MKKKYIALMVCLMTFLISASTGFAENGIKVILVSDNVADSAVAEALQNVKNMEIITTPWGEFDEAVVIEIDSLDPTNIIIIGGSDAVPSDYDDALESYNVVRLPGRDRYDTASQVLGRFKDDFKGKGIVVAYGYDSKGIRKALEHAKSLGWFVLFIKTDDIPDEVEAAIEGTDADDIDVFDSPNTEDEKVLRKLNRTKKRIRLHSLNESEKEKRASEQIEEAREEIEEAEEEIGECIVGSASKLLDLAKRHLEKAESAFGEGQYGQAFGQAISAEHLAENSERKAKHSLCLGLTRKNGRDVHDNDVDEEDDDEIKFCSEIETLTCPNAETELLTLIGGQTFILTNETEYGDGINSCEELNVSDLIKVEAKNESGTLYAREIELENHCDDDDEETTTTTLEIEDTTMSTTTTTSTTLEDVETTPTTLEEEDSTTTTITTSTTIEDQETTSTTLDE
jgi:putative cell wall-binding protein